MVYGVRNDVHTQFKKIFLVPLAQCFGAVATAGAFLSCFAKKRSQRRRPHETRKPLICGQSSGGCGTHSLRSLKQSSPKPRPLVPRFGVFQGEDKKPCAKSVVIAVFGDCVTYV
ncbi:hypothetical protein C1H71_16200 [Iodobacter fluviatilis]|uniref:Uncharacterized protein n=1 Tax=Iodobacter fluviatilis TaxID=537 RepID=A0A7G3GDD3_9NEIS|nr:hypothetical protein C1H71_16200 [Iodobacter fluviatilis]